MVFLAASVANVQAAIEHIFPLLYEFRKERPKVASETASVAGSGGDPTIDAMLGSSSDEEVFGADSDDNVSKDGRLKEESFWSDEDENGKSKSGRNYLTGGGVAGKKRRLEGRTGGGGGASKVAKKTGRFAKKPHRRKPLGKASNDPSEDVMGISDGEDADGF